MPSLSSVRLVGRCDCSTSRMISRSDGSLRSRVYFATLRERMRDTSCVVVPIRDYAFFEQAVLEREVGDAFLQGTGFALQFLDLVGRGRAGGVTRQAPLAGLQLAKQTFTSNSFDQT